MDEVTKRRFEKELANREYVEIPEIKIDFDSIEEIVYKMKEKIDNEELKINKIINMLSEAENNKQKTTQENYGFYAGQVEVLKNVLDILQN